MPAAAIGAMGYCYMWWKGLSLSDVMFVTKHNMANVVATVSKQLESVSEALSSTKKHLAKRLETLGGRMDEQKEISNFIANDDVEKKLIEDSKVSVERNSPKWLQFLAETKEPNFVKKSMLNTKSNDFGKNDSAKINPPVKTRINRSYPVGLSMARGMLDL